MNQKTEQFFDKHLFLGKALEVNEHITIQTPKIRAIIEFGEEKYFNVINTLTGIPSPETLYIFLHNKNIGYREFQELDFFFFALMIRNLTPADTRLLFGDLNLSKYEVAQRNDTKEYVLYNQENEAVIERYEYEIMMDYIHQMHDIERILRRQKADNIFNKVLSESHHPELNNNAHKHYQAVLLPLVKQYPAYMELTIFAFYHLVKSGALSE